jgi:hypothetical protein
VKSQEEKEKERERREVLARLGRETIIKYGTYDLDDVRKIDPDHPERKPEEQQAPDAPEAAESMEPISDEDASALADQILASNFKVGMSQSEVDSFMNGMV